MDVQAREIEIPTAEGHQLSSVKFSSKKSVNQTIVISSATGVLQKYYAKFAQFFASQGFIVYTFDYHGIGKSGYSTSDLKNNTINLKSWGQNDQAAVIAFAKRENPDASLTLITHSVGGQLLGFNANHSIIDKVILVASQTGYWKEFRGIHRFKMWSFWYALIPLITPIFGYFPAKKLGLFENLPKNMVYEWASWGKQKKYMMHFYNQSDYFFDAIKIPMLALSFSKDDFAPQNTVDQLAQHYSNAQLERVHNAPKKGEKHIRHFGFFKSSFKEPLWEQSLQWIINSTYQL